MIDGEYRIQLIGFMSDEQSEDDLPRLKYVRLNTLSFTTMKYYSIVSKEIAKVFTLDDL